MTERERWIVYPLLFLALGAALRDKLLKQTIAERIICSELLCNDLMVLEGSQPVARLRGDTLEMQNMHARGGVRVDGALVARAINAGSVQQRGRPVGAVGLQQLWRMFQDAPRPEGEPPDPPAHPEPPAAEPPPAAGDDN